ncbi:DUF433 domain-containing protein [Nocardia thailandica]|uniref:DUF433 domain-containing protein n=1 Tax=Nocardia thailandica TaxID=257275 RepID=UPI000693BA70|nr:DUF433 domain-containing protein [Nocardia thailandica]
MSHQHRFSRHPGRCLGSTVVRGIRYRIEMLIGLLSNGTAVEDLFTRIPGLEFDELLAALEYAALRSVPDTESGPTP